ncbi:MAG: hypothetical protein HYY06_27825 [Deltaproteobacteria bacterium]|nr:hypothetical protein [Deltaproteobacteria bacterium]
MTGPLQRIRDEIVRRLLGFSPFEMEDDMRRLQRLVERLREEHAREVERLRAEVRRLKGEPHAAGDNGDGRTHLPVA